MEQMTIPKIAEVKLKGSFWEFYQKLIKEKVIPFQWNVLNDCQEGVAPCYTVYNFRLAAGEITGEYRGLVYQDSDLYKWLEAVGNVLQYCQDEGLKEKADSIIDLISKAQQPDGYLNTYFQLKMPGKRWTNILECHELYCAGHFFEAAVSYYKATGDKKVIEIAKKLADCIDHTFGPEEGKLHGYPGHQEIELGLIRLYEITKEIRYLNLSMYFIKTRGTNNFFEEEFEKRGKMSYWLGHTIEEPNRPYNQYPYQNYNQFHKAVIKQEAATGHAVRAVYMYAAMAELAGITGEKMLLEACKKIFLNIINKQMYITGGIGSTPSGEAFTYDYDLPNDTNYSETCASIALILFCQKMLLNEVNGAYGDTIERALYNTVLAGLGSDGRSFFYVNPLEMSPSNCERNPERRHIKPIRQPWYATACCPPNIARLLSSLSRYIYSCRGDVCYVHLYTASEAAISLPCGETLKLRQETNFPYDGKVTILVDKAPVKPIKLALRIPGWCDFYTAKYNEKPLNVLPANGYLYTDCSLTIGDRITLDMSMKPVLMRANKHLLYDGGKAAVQRGPLVYCIEEADNGPCLGRLSIDETAPIREIAGSDGTIFLELTGKQSPAEEGDVLYAPNRGQALSRTIRAVPYYTWNNRGSGEMKVWIPTY